MGQGILHYTSSYLHAAMVSFRDELYRKICNRKSWDYNDHGDLFSSDDSFTVQSVEIHDIPKMLEKIDCFLKCQEISERLFNCTTSKSKSSINPVIGEFNSLFVSNLTLFPTLFKFTVSSVHPFATDSFHKMVKESYNSTRQICENGGSLDLYMVAHWMNKRYCETIYHTAEGSYNNLRDLGISNMPYHLGEYPIFNPSLMLMFGPEFHNYLLYKRLNTLSENERKLFKASHKILKGDLIESLGDIETTDAMLGGLLRIEANVGPVSQLLRLRKSSAIPIEELRKTVNNDPLILIKRPRSHEEILFKTCYKLFVPGAQEAVKTISASIYYGRVAASTTAHAYYIPNSEFKHKTYRECLLHLLDTETPTKSFERHIKFLYPRWEEYEMLSRTHQSIVADQYRNILEIQSTRNLAVHRIHTRLTNSIPDVLEYLWRGKIVPDHEINRYERDIIILKNFFPLIQDTFNQTLDQFSGTTEDKTKGVLMLILKTFSLRDRSFKGIIYGSSSHDVLTTYENLNEGNYTLQKRHKVDFPEAVKVDFKKINFNKIFATYNYHILSRLAEVKIDENEIWKNVTDEEIKMFIMDNHLGKNTKKRVFMCLVSIGRIDDILTWSGKMSCILHYWNLRQRFNKKDGKWYGNFELVLFMGLKMIKVYYIEKFSKYIISKSDFDDPVLLYEFFDELKAILTKPDIQDILKYVDRGDWILHENKILQSYGMGFKMSKFIGELPIYNEQIIMDVNDEKITLYDSMNKQVLSILTGLMDCYKEDLNLPNFEIFGLDYDKIQRIGALNKNFSITNMRKSEVLELLDTLDVKKPTITDIAKTRLGLGDSWEVSTDVKEDIEIHLAEPEYDYRSFFVNVDLSSIKVDWDYHSITDFVQYFSGTDFFNTSTTTSEIYFPRKLYEELKHLKYDCICYLVTFNLQVSKNTISILSSYLKKSESRTHILYSLISRYSRTIQTTDESSPLDAKLDIKNIFLRKFKIKTSNIEEAFS
jgi:hypothetical protein